MIGKKLTSKELADLIVDALIDAGFVQPESRREATDVVIEEIDARKGLGDY
jgi:hypothetical protein